MAMASMALAETGEWSTSAWDCCANSSCCPCLWNVFGFPCIAYGMLTEKNGQGFWGGCCLMLWCPCCACCYGADTRQNIRKKYGLAPNPCSDCMMYCFCRCCAILQEYRQLDEPLPQVQGMPMMMMVPGQPQYQQQAPAPAPEMK